MCYFGHYDPDYSRNRILMKALRRAGADIVEIRSTQTKAFRYLDLLKQGLRESFDLIFVGATCHTDVPLAKWLANRRKTPLIFDAFISYFDSNVFDRRTVSEQSVAAKKYFWMDKLACWLADVVLLDTRAHIQYFADTFEVRTSKFRRVWVGADDEVMYARTQVTDRLDTFTVFFYGSFIPLQGIEYIIKAAKILEANGESIRFTIVGSGQTYPAIRQTAQRLGVHNVDFLGPAPYEQLPVLMSQSDVCLGIFGTTPKARRVIPNKVFDALAVRQPVITADTPAINEVLAHREHLWLCPAGHEEALADAILTLKQNSALRRYLAQNGYEHFRNHFSIDAISKDLTTVVEGLLSDGRRG